MPTRTRIDLNRSAQLSGYIGFRSVVITVDERALTVWPGDTAMVLPIETVRVEGRRWGGLGTGVVVAEGTRELVLRLSGGHLLGAGLTGAAALLVLIRALAGALPSGALPGWVLGGRASLLLVVAGVVVGVCGEHASTKRSALLTAAGEHGATVADRQLRRAGEMGWLRAAAATTTRLRALPAGQRGGRTGVPGVWLGGMAVAALVLAVPTLAATVDALGVPASLVQTGPASIGGVDPYARAVPAEPALPWPAEVVVDRAGYDGQLELTATLSAAAHTAFRDDLRGVGWTGEQAEGYVRWRSGVVEMHEVSVLEGDLVRMQLTVKD